MYIQPGSRYSSPEAVENYEIIKIQPKEDVLVEWSVSQDANVWAPLSLGKYQLSSLVASPVPSAVFNYAYFRLVVPAELTYRTLTVTKEQALPPDYIPVPSSLGQILQSTLAGTEWTNTPNIAGMFFSWNGVTARWIKNNYAASANPTTAADTAAGYDIGSIWVNTTTGRLFLCTAATEGAATWAGIGHDIRNITVTIDGGGGGAAIVAGGKTWVRIPYAATITAWHLLADQAGDIVIDVQKAAFPTMPTTSIAAAAKPTLSAGASAFDLTLTGWTKEIAAGDIILFEIESAATLTQVMLQLTLEVE